eukprot:scaffold160_cov18-Tisochrysis_lutea.AAC.1
MGRGGGCQGADHSRSCFGQGAAGCEEEPVGGACNANFLPGAQMTTYSSGCKARAQGTACGSLKGKTNFHATPHAVLPRKHAHTCTCWGQVAAGAHKAVVRVAEGGHRRGVAAVRVHLAAVGRAEAGCALVHERMWQLPQGQLRHA